MKNIYKSNEIETLNLLYPNDPTEIVRHLVQQVLIVDNKGQGLMSLGGILLAITASLLPTLNSLAYWAWMFIVLGSSFVFVSILWNALFLFRLEWISQIETPKLDHNAIIERALKIRAGKARAYHSALAIMILGLLCYLLSLLSLYALTFS